MNDLNLDEIFIYLKVIINSHFADITEEKRSELIADIDNASQNIYQWKEHIVRSVNQDRGRTDLLDSLKRDEALIVMDWDMIFLPMSYREKQSDWFGQKGINWHVSVCIFKDELDNLKVINLKQNNAYYEDILLRKRRI